MSTRSPLTPRLPSPNKRSDVGYSQLLGDVADVLVILATALDVPAIGQELTAAHVELTQRHERCMILKASLGYSPIYGNECPTP